MSLIPSAPLLVVVHTKRGDNIRIIVRDSRADENDEVMKKRREKNNGMLPEYDFSQGVRGKYARRYAKGSNVVVLEADVAKVFPNSEAVNSSLRSLAQIIHRQKSVATKWPQGLTILRGYLQFAAPRS